MRAPRESADAGGLSVRLRRRLQPALDRIEREWIAAKADPNLAEPICWFAPRSA